MDYTSIYSSFISSRACRVNGEFYTEKHHIIPRCAGGNNAANNLIRLTPREHVFAHRVLMRMHTGELRKKLSFAYHMMVTNRKIGDIDKAREYLSSSQKGEKRQYSPEHLKRMAENGRHSITFIDNTGMVTAKDLLTGEFVKVTKGVFDASTNLVGVNYGRNLVIVNKSDHISKMTEAERKVFGKKGQKNNASATASLDRYGRMTDAEFNAWCENKSERGIKRAKTFRERYKRSQRSEL